MSVVPVPKPESSGVLGCRFFFHLGVVRDLLSCFDISLTPAEAAVVFSSFCAFLLSSSNKNCDKSVAVLSKNIRCV